MHKPGDKIKIITKEKEFEGILMPNESDDSIFIKLDSGYNIGVEKKKIKEIKIVQKRKEKKSQDKKITDRKGKKKILILHTGGTIASKVDYETGGVTAKFTAADLVEMVPELVDIANIDCDFVSNMMSEDMDINEYHKIINSIKKHLGKCDGIIIGHGTDTLAYTSAALAFSINNPSIPILLVGSQRSSDRPSSDSALNLICAAQFIAKSDFKGVALCMHHSSNDDTCAILPATKSRKMHTARRDAFKVINSEAIATVNAKGKVEWKGEVSEGKTEIKDKFSDQVGLLKVHPILNTKLLEFYTKNFKAIVVEATGLGHMPTNTKENEKNYQLLKQFINNNGIVAITSQCLYGRVHPNVYTNLRRLSEIGCIFCEDMLPETAYIKLSWLLGNYSVEESKKLLIENLRGEISDRTLYEEDFLE